MKPLPVLCYSAWLKRTLPSILCAIVLGGCSTTMYVSNSIPYDTQQNIETISGEGVIFDFVPGPNSEQVEAKVDLGSTITYRINDPLYGMYHELMQTKFGGVGQNATDTVKVKIIDITTSTRSPTVGSDRSHTLGLTVKVETVRDGMSSERNLSYETVFPAMQVPGAGGKYTFPSGSVQDFLLKFIISSDKFIDATYSSQGN